MKPLSSEPLNVLQIGSRNSSQINLAVVSLEASLKQCLSLVQFNQILSQVIISGFLRHTFASSRLLHFSTKSLFIALSYTYTIFTRIEKPNGFIYNTMMRALVQSDCPERAINVYRLLLLNRDEPDSYTFPILAQSCGAASWEFGGYMVHCQARKMGFGQDVYVRNNLIHMHSICGNMKAAHKVFNESPVSDTVTWNSLLAGYVSLGDVEEAKNVFRLMPVKNVISSNSMIALYGKKGLVKEARRLFDDMPQRDIVSWGALVSCYEQNKLFDDAFQTFKAIVQSGCSVDEIIALTVLSACANFPSASNGKSIHALVLKIGIQSYVNLENALIHLYSTFGDLATAERLFNEASCLNLYSWNSMLNAYLKSCDVVRARELFDVMPEKDLVSWSTMISGYAQNGRCCDALALFQNMQLNGIEPDEMALVSVITACTDTSALQQGKWVHAYISKNNLKINDILGTTLVNMYMKFGCVQNALEVFYDMKERGISTWNALILGLAMNGLTEKSLETFTEMKAAGMVPNEITYMAVLAACRHMGLVDDGQRFFRSMVEEYNIEPNIKHYGCIVDLLGRAGRLKEAEIFIKQIPMVPEASTWGALLGACSKHGNLEMGERLGKELIMAEPEHDGFHVLLSNIYASKGNWDDVIELRGTMMKQGVVKIPGCSIIEADGEVHEFLAGDSSHKRIKHIEEVLKEILRRLQVEGYTPDTEAVALDIDEEEKGTALVRHSEKLAIAFGLISITPPTPIRIMKNLRICNDCHSTAKMVSKVYDREIIIRDRHRFHHFKQGSCSCLDYW